MTVLGISSWNLRIKGNVFFLTMAILIFFDETFLPLETLYLLTFVSAVIDIVQRLMTLSVSWDHSEIRH